MHQKIVHTVLTNSGKSVMTFKSTIFLIECRIGSDKLDQNLLCIKKRQMLAYRKIPVISPGLIQLRKGFGWTYKRRGLYPGGLISGIKKTFRNEPRQC